MYLTIILYWLLLLITITATFDKKNQIKFSKDSSTFNINNIDKYGPEELCNGHSINSNSHQIKKYSKVIILIFS